MKNERDINKEYHSLFLLYFIRFFGDAAFYAFFQLFVKSKNITDTKTGLLLSIAPIAIIIMTPVWSKLAKNSNRNKEILVITSIIEGILIIIMGNMSAYEAILIITILISFSGTQFYSLLDGFSGTFAAVNNKDYTPIRMFGSMGYIVSLLLVGQITEHIGFKYAFYIAGFLIILCSYLLHRLKPVDLDALPTEDSKPHYKELLTNKRFIFYGLFYVLTFTLAFVGDNFFSLYLTDQSAGYGITTGQWGYIYALMVVIEVLTMLIISRFKIKDYYMYIAAVIAMSIRYLVVGSNPGLILTVAVSCLRGVGVGVFLGIHIKHLTKILSMNNLTFGILIIQVLHNIVLAVGNNLFPKIAETYDYPKAYLLIGIMIGVMSVIYLVVGLFDTRDYENKKVISTIND